MGAEVPEAADAAQPGTSAEPQVVPLSLAELKECDIAAMAKDKMLTRQLLKSISLGGAEVVQYLYSQAEPLMTELVSDMHGHYLVQRLLEVVSDEQFLAVFNSLKKDLLSLAKDAHGTRVVQKIIDQSIARKMLPPVLEALPAEQTAELASHISGFRVVVKLLETLSLENAAPLLERLCSSGDKVVALAKDQWGCCVVKKCADHSRGPLRERVIEAIASNALDLVQDKYGNYAVQHLIINNTAEQNVNAGRIIDSLKGHICELALQKFSSNALEKCLATHNVAERDRNKIIGEILSPPDGRKPSEAIHKLLFHQFGNYVIQQALEVARDPLFSLLIQHSKHHIQELYIEATRQQAQSSMQDPDAEKPGPDAEGNLHAEHCQRLAVKLVKRYPALTTGMDMGNVMVGTETSWMFEYDPFGYGYGYMGLDGFGYPPPYMQNDMQQWMRSAGGKGGRGKGQKGHRSGKGSKGAGKGSSVTPGGETVKVGRIVGFWPNYQYVEDEVTSANSRQGTRPRKGKSSSKA